MFKQIILSGLLVALGEGLVHNQGHKPWPHDQPRPSLLKTSRRADPPPKYECINQRGFKNFITEKLSGNGSGVMLTELTI